MQRQRSLALALSSLAALFLVAGCNVGPSAAGSFERSYPVSGPLRIELNSASGDVQIRGGSGNTVQIHADVTARGMGFDDPKKLLADTISNPPIELKGNTLRIGKDLSRVRNMSVSYRITVPHETEVNSNVAAGTQSVFEIRGPLKIQSASGSIRVQNVDGAVQLNSMSGSIEASDAGDDVRANTLAGNISVSNTKGDVRVGAVSGSIQIKKAGGRVDGETVSGSVDVRDAVNDVRARSGSGRVAVHGNPAASSYWQLTTVSGVVLLGVPASSNFHLTAEASSGEIRADIPIVVEEQTKHALRAHVGSGGGRVEVHTSSGQIRVSGPDAN